MLRSRSLSWLARSRSSDAAKSGSRRSLCYTQKVGWPGESGSSAAYTGTFGEWLSLVEHLVRDQGVGGSNPLSPTT